MGIDWQMTTAISIEDVRREVKILKALSGHKNIIKFYDAFEDENNVYIAMEYVYSVLLLRKDYSSYRSSTSRFG
jgi:serine/threonine protein kinase